MPVANGKTAARNWLASGAGRSSWRRSSHRFRMHFGGSVPLAQVSREKLGGEVCQGLENGAFSVAVRRPPNGAQLAPRAQMRTGTAVELEPRRVVVPHDEQRRDPYCFERLPREVWSAVLRDDRAHLRPRRRGEQGGSRARRCAEIAD